MAFRRALHCAIRCTMADNFDAQQFLDRLNMGEFDGHIPEELRKLTHEQIEQVALLMIKRNDENAKEKGAG